MTYLLSTVTGDYEGLPPALDPEPLSPAPLPLLHPPELSLLATYGVLTMRMPPTRPRTCPVCPYLDEFHSTCSHPMRQMVIQEIAENDGPCAVYPEIQH